MECECDVREPSVGGAAGVVECRMETGGISALIGRRAEDGMLAWIVVAVLVAAENGKTREGHRDGLDGPRAVCVEYAG